MTRRLVCCHVVNYESVVLSSLSFCSYEKSKRATRESSRESRHILYKNQERQNVQDIFVVSISYTREKGDYSTIAPLPRESDATSLASSRLRDQQQQDCVGVQLMRFTLLWTDPITNVTVSQSWSRMIGGGNTRETLVAINLHRQRRRWMDQHECTHNEIN
jgi:hypothetical protein